MGRERRSENVNKKPKSLNFTYQREKMFQKMNVWVWGVGTGEREEEKRMVSKILPLVFKEIEYVRWLINLMENYNY